MADRRLLHFLWLTAACVLAGCPGGTGVSGVLEVSRVEVAPPGGEIVLGGTLQLTATPRTASGIAVPNRTPIWSSTNQAIASVSQGGLVTAQGVGGPVTITARVDGVGGTASVTVSPVPVSQVTVAPPQVDIQVGESVPLTATARDASGQPLNRQVAWSSDNQAIAQVNTAGVVLGVEPGNTVIRATAEGKTGTAEVTVRPRPATRLTFLTQPPNGVAGQPLAPPIQVAVQDAIGNTVTTATTTITVALSTNPTGATLKGTTTRNAVAGIATFGDLSVEKAGTGYVLEATAVVLAPGLSTPFAIASGPGQKLAITTQPPATAGSGVPFAPQPVVQIQDAFGNAVAQAGIQITASVGSGTGGTLSGSAIATTDASGAAIFTNLALNGPAGGYTVQFTAPSLASVVSGTITLTAGTATQLALVTPPSSNAQSGVPLAQQPSVQLRDGSGNPVQQAGVTVTATVSPGSGTLSGTTAVVTSASGTATFTNLAISGSTGTYTLSFNATGTGGVSSGPITLGAGPAVRLIIVTQPSSTATSGTPFAQQPVLQVTDLSGNPVSQSGIAVTAALASGAGTLGGALTVNTNAAGRASYTNLSITGSSGSYTIGFSAPGLNGAVSNPISLGAGTPTQLAIVTQPSSTAQSGVAFPQQPVVGLRDALNNPVAQAGVNVTASIASGGGTLAGAVTVPTDANGVATFTDLQISGTVGNRTLRFDAPGLTGVTSNTINLTPGSPSQLAVTVQPSPTAQSGVAFAQQPVVQLRDAAGNNVLQAGVSVSASIASGAGATLSGGPAVTDANGQATFTNLTLTGTSGNYTLGFAATGLTGATSNAIALGAGAGSKLALTQQPSASVKNGAVFPQQPIIQLLDASNNPVPQAGVLVSVAIQTGAPALSGTTTVPTDATGKATFTDLVITGVVGGRTLIFAASGFVSVTSNTVTVVAGDAAALQLTTQPSANAQSGVPFPQQPVVQLVDQSGNAVSQASVNVIAVIASGGGTLGGTATVATNASGVATYTDLRISGTVGNRTLRFDAMGLTSVTSNTISLGAGPATQLTITTQPSASAQAGVAFLQQPVIQLRDDGGNAVSQAGVNVTAVIASSPGGSPTLGGNATVATNSSGAAPFTDLSISGLVGNYTLRFDATGLASATSQTITLAAGAATKLGIAQQPSATVQNGIAFPQQPVIQVQDAGGNPVSQANVSVSVAIQSGGPTLSGTTNAVTDATGLATFTDLVITGVAGDRTLIFAASGLTSVTSNTVTVVGGSPVALALTTQPSSSAQSGVAFPQQPVVQVVDQSGNAVSQAGIDVTAVIASGGGTLGGTATVATNANGVATFTDLRISGTVGDRTLRFDATGLTSVTSNTISLGAGPATQLTITTQPSASALPGVPFGQQPVIQLRDASGNAVSQAGVDVNAVIASSPGGSPTLGGDATVATNSSGVAQFTDLSITGPTGAYTLRFDATGLTSATSQSITLTAGGATKLGITTQPSSTAQSGVAFPQQPVIQVQDGGGNPVSQAGISVSAVIASNPGGTPTLGGIVSVTTDGNGVATFTDLSISGSVGDYTLRFDATGLTSVISNTITLSAGSAARVLVTQEPSSSAQNTVAFAQQPKVRLVDGGGNFVTAPSVNVTAAIFTGGGTLSGLTTVTTDGTGTATFTNLAITGTIGNRTLEFTAPSLISDVSAVITITPGPATQLGIATQPSSTVQNDVPFPVQPAIQLRDVSGNDVSQDNVSVVVAIASGGGTLGGTTTASTNGSGTATFTDLRITGTVGDRTLTFTSTGLTSATSNTITVTPGTATQLTITTQPPTNASTGVALSPSPVVQLRDVSGNAVSLAGISVDADVQPPAGGASLGGTTTVMTDAAGAATFSNLFFDVTSPPGTYKIRFRSTGLTTAVSNDISVL